MDANALVRRLDLLELVISDEIANLELEIALQMYRERVDRLDERLHEFRQSQELP